MRALHVIRQALLVISSSTALAFVLITAVREFADAPNGNGLWAGLIPLTERKWPWLILILSMVALLWRIAHRLGGSGGTLWGAAIWLRLLAFWWSILALVVFCAALVAGMVEQPLWNINVGFAMTYLLVTLSIMFGSEFSRKRMHKAPKVT